MSVRTQAVSRRPWGSSVRAVRLAFAVLIFRSVAVGQEVQSDFAIDTDGWLAHPTPIFSGHISDPAGGAAILHDPGEGVPPGSIQVGDVFGETAVAAPSKFLGDQVAAYKGLLEYQIFIRFTDGVAYPAVYLAGATKTLYHTGPLPGLFVWTSVSVPIDVGSWTVDATTGPMATEADLLDVLADLKGLFIRTEWHTGDDFTNVDQVAVTYGYGTTVGEWTDLGGGAPGIAGQPTLSGTGLLVAGTTTVLALTNAPPLAPMLAWISFNPTPFPALGGTVHAYPFASQLALFANANGEFSASTAWPAGIPAGTEVYFQFIVQDLSVPGGLTLSNGLKATTP